MKVAWDVSHGEFLITDYYYFSKLRNYAKEENIKIEAINVFEVEKSYDVYVFNYPEKPFSEKEVKKIEEFALSSLVVFTAYYSNIDEVADVVNSVSKNFGIHVKSGVIKDKKNNIGDDMFPIAVWSKKGKKESKKEVVMPCSAPVEGGKAIVKSKSGSDVFATKCNNLIVLGTCVFWDNYSLDYKNNRLLALSLLRGEI